jgi:hypothetical protein
VHLTPALFFDLLESFSHFKELPLIERVLKTPPLLVFLLRIVLVL